MRPHQRLRGNTLHAAMSALAWQWVRVSSACAASLHGIASRAQRQQDGRLTWDQQGVARIVIDAPAPSSSTVSELRGVMDDTLVQWWRGPLAAVTASPLRKLPAGHISRGGRSTPCCKLPVQMQRSGGSHLGWPVDEIQLCVVAKHSAGGRHLRACSNKGGFGEWQAAPCLARAGRHQILSSTEAGGHSH